MNDDPLRALGGLQRDALLDREATLTRDLLRLYHPLELSLQEQIKQLKREIPTVEILTAEEKEWKLKRTRALLDHLREEMAVIERRAVRLIARSQWENVAAGIADSHAMAREIGLGSSFDNLPVDALHQLVGIMADGSPLADTLRSVSAENLGALKQTLFSGVAQGLAPATIARNLQDTQQDLTRRRAVLIARQESVRAYREAGRANYANNDEMISGWRWLATRSKRSCPTCLALDGSVHPLSEQFGGHPACRCTTTPVIEGMSSSRETGEEWFAQQPPHVQEQILGKATFKLYQSGAITLQDLVERKASKWGPTANVKSVSALMASGKISQEDGHHALTKSLETFPVVEIKKQSPLGKAISDALVLPGPGAKNRKAIKHAVQVIDSVHGDGKPAKTVIKSVRLPEGVHGQHTNASHLVEINNVGKHPAPVMATLHELGHFLDYQALPGEGATTIGHPEKVDAWKKAVDNSQRFKEITAADIDEKYRKYLLSPKELWARSYAQYVATKSDDPVASQELSWMRGNMTRFVWSQEDFQPIYNAIDSLFRGLQWLK